MRLRYRFSLLLSLPILFAAMYARSQDLSAQPQSGAKVCVAIVNDQTAELLNPDRMTARLVNALADKKLIAVAMESSTGNSRDLRPTLENSQEMKDKQCDYMVLTMVIKSDTRPGPGNDAQISIGHARVPSTDASDPLGGQSGPVYRRELDVNFAVFKPGNPKPVLDTSILERSSANTADSFMQAMDREGGRISHELKKK